MGETFKPGDKVRVRLVRRPECQHARRDLPIEGATGEVMAVYPERDHPLAVWLNVWIMGTRWTDSFRADELEPIPPPG